MPIPLEWLLMPLLPHQRDRVWQVATAVLIARGVRYFGLAWLIRRLGDGQ